MVIKHCGAAALIASSMLLPVSASAEWSGRIAIATRAFAQPPANDVQHDDSALLLFQPEYYLDWDDGNQSLVLVPYVRFDPEDESRNRADIAELMWRGIHERWELSAGISRVFWGVTESQHLVDIINQSDLAADPDGETKLGQPMLKISFAADRGTLDIFALPGFRPRTFPGEEARLRPPLPVDNAMTQYASSSGDRHADLAIRWMQSISLWDIGLSYFAGTSREPILVPMTNANGRPVLAPYYSQIRQAGADVQATLGAWLWKLEAIHRRGQGRPYVAATGGFEYTFGGVMNTRADLGVLMEYLYDERGDAALTLFFDDWFTGMRLAFNDVNSTNVLAGIIVNGRGDWRLLNLEASRRMGSNWRLNLEARGFRAQVRDDLLYGLRNDDYVQLELEWYF